MTGSYEPWTLDGENPEQAWQRIIDACAQFYAGFPKPSQYATDAALADAVSLWLDHNAKQCREVDWMHHNLDTLAKRAFDPVDDAAWSEANITPLTAVDLLKLAPENRQNGDLHEPVPEQDEPFDLDQLRRPSVSETATLGSNGRTMAPTSLPRYLAYQQAARKLNAYRLPRTIDDSIEALRFGRCTQTNDYRALMVPASERNATGYWNTSRNEPLYDGEGKKLKGFAALTDKHMALPIRFARQACSRFAAMGIPIYPRHYDGDTVFLAHMVHHEAMRGRMIDVVIAECIAAALECDCSFEYEPPLAFTVSEADAGNQQRLKAQRQAILLDQDTQGDL